MVVRRTAAALVAAALLLAGCSDDPEPQFSPPSASPSPTESESSAEPEAQTPEEFIREWVKLHTEMQNSGDTEAFRAVSTSCEPCVDLADLVDDYYAAGGFVQTDGWTIRSLKQLNETGAQITFEAQIRSAETEVAETADSDIQTLPAGEGTERFVLKEVDGAWQMIDIAEVAG